MKVWKISLRKELTSQGGPLFSSDKPPSARSYCYLSFNGLQRRIPATAGKQTTRISTFLKLEASAPLMKCPSVKRGGGGGGDRSLGVLSNMEFVNTFSHFENISCSYLRQR